MLCLSCFELYSRVVPLNIRHKYRRQFMLTAGLWQYTVFIRISAQPRISAHLEQAPILKAEKVNKRPASNKRPPHHPFLPLPLKLKLATPPKIE